MKNVESELEHAANTLRWQKEQDQGTAKSQSATGEKQQEQDVEASRNDEARNLLADPKIRRRPTRLGQGRQQSKMDVERENNFNRLKRRIVDAYRNYHPVQHNVSREERRAIRTLKERELTVKC